MAAPESVASCSARESARNKITIIQLGHNSCNYEYREKQVNIAEYDRMLTDPGQVDCPLLQRLGYPVILVRSMPGTKCIPQVQVLAVSNNPHNNRAATVAASRINTGLAMGCVVGEVYALRKDTKSLTGAEWEVLSDMLDQLMNDYEEGPGYVDDARLTRYKRRTREAMPGRGLRQPGAGTGKHCLECGEEEGEEARLLRCGSCKMAYYCSRACQKVIARRATAHLVPRGLAQADPQLAGLANAMPPEVYRLFVFNRVTAERERICPQCRTMYRLLENPDAGDRASTEQRLSGMCSYACFAAFHPEGSHSGPEWYGQEAVQPEGLTFFTGTAPV